MNLKKVFFFEFISSCPKDRGSTPEEDKISATEAFIRAGWGGSPVIQTEDSYFSNGDPCRNFETKIPTWRVLRAMAYKKIKNWIFIQEKKAKVLMR